MARHRWNNLSVDEEQRAQLPGYGEEAVIRHFEAPGAVSTRFYEVRARSILNRVPEASRMPFRWTINPYRGCTHACVYCLSGDTRVLLADGRETPLRDLGVGDVICGTQRQGSYRRLVETPVLAKWSSLKPAFRVELEDDTELIASDEHRFLTRRGWKHMVGSEQGRFRRPHLTIGSQVIGPGGSTEPPVHDVEYRRGYLCGMIRGDGALTRCADERPGRTNGDERPGRTNGDVYRLGPALADPEELLRSREFLRLSLGTELSQVSGEHRAMSAIRTRSRDSFERGSELIEWPRAPSLSWVKGFLAGIFDADGCCSRGVLRISSTDEQIIKWVQSSWRRLGFDCVIERRIGAASAVRLRGGIVARMRFLLMVDPASGRKRSITGTALKSDAALTVASIEALGLVMRMYDITTGTGDFIANGVVSHNCFARPTHTYLDFGAGRDFEREIVVKVNAPERLRVELAKPAWKGEHIALGTNTDPYQWVEGRYKLMPGIWAAMIEARNPASVLTKSPLLLRDLALMRELAERADFSAALSVPTIDERAWRATEPHTPNPRARLEAVAELNRAGIRTGILVAPLMPGINDAPEQVAKILELAAAAGAAYVSGIALHLRGDVRGLFMEWLAAHRPDLVARYRDLYRHGAYAPMRERRRLAGLIGGSELEPSERLGVAVQPAAAADSARAARQESLFDTGSRGETVSLSRW